MPRNELIRTKDKVHRWYDTTNGRSLLQSFYLLILDTDFTRPGHTTGFKISLKIVRSSNFM